MRAPVLLFSVGVGLWISACAPVGQRTHYQRWREETEQRHAEEAKAEAEAKALEAQKAGGTKTATRAATMINEMGTPAIPPPPAGRVIRPQDTPPPPPPPTDDAVY